MHLLVLGGTGFLSRAVVTAALDRGHRVTAANRGRTGALPDGATWVRWDREEPAPPGLGTGVDAVVDVSRSPGQVTRALAALTGPHWVFVSTVSVYADTATPGARADAALVEPIAGDRDLSTTPEAYGPMKVACEQAVLARANAVVVRPGLIVGPGDPTGRFTYWPVHADAAHRDGGPLLVPGDPGDLVQVIDVRDLAGWLVELAAARTTGAFDAVGVPMPMSRLVADLHEAVGPSRVVHVPTATLHGLGVAPWAGPGSVPLWVDEPGHEGFLARDPSESLGAGLRTRPLTETISDTLAWARATPDAVVTGLDRAAELAILADLGHH